MSKIILISCVSKKLGTKSKAQDLYISPLFKKNFAYAKSLNPHKIFILSAKYGLVNLNQRIEPYNKTLNEMKNSEIKEWANLILTQMKEIFNLDEDEFIFLAGNNYRKFLIKHIKNYKVPMEGLGIGKQLQWLSNKIKNE